MVVMAAVFIRDQPTFVELLGGGQNNGKFISKTPFNLQSSGYVRERASKIMTASPYKKPLSTSSLITICL